MARVDPLVLTMEEAAKVLAISRSKLYTLVGAGKIPVTRIGRSVRIPRVALEEFVARNTRPAKEE